MPTPQTPHADTRRVPGWERVLNAFMADPDRILTNVQLGQIPGVQAFHQRTTDLVNYGYVLTPAVKLPAGNGHYAYALVGVDPRAGRWPFRHARPHADRLPEVTDALRDDQVEAAVRSIEVKADALLKRNQQTAEPSLSLVAPTRALRDAVTTLQGALGDHIADWRDVDRHDILALTRKTVELLEDGREVAAELNRRLANMPTDADLQALGEDLEGAQADRNLSRGELDDIVAVLGIDPNASGSHGAVLERVRELVAAPSRGPRAEDAPTGPELMRKALEAANRPMHSERIAEWVMAHGGAAVYFGRTPAKTMRGQLLKSDASDGPFVKVTPGCYGLREWATSGAEGGPQVDEFGWSLLDLDPIR
jgi:hypothetical protein